MGRDLLLDVPDETTAIRLLTTDPDTGEDTGWLGCPGSRYGRTSADCAPIAARVAFLISAESGEPMIWAVLDDVMSQVVNDSDSPAYILATYGDNDERADWADYAREED